MPFNPPPAVESRTTVDASDDPLELLRQANAKQSYHWLEANSPDHFDAVCDAVKRGATPDEIYHFMLRDTFRLEIAHRCRLAARWLVMERQ